jgi:nucleoside 2-deoxyribosyltransferase-like protein
MKIVLTGISATPYAREYISNAARTLRERGHQVFVPHEGSWQPPDKPAEADRFDFEATYQALREADLLMAILDGYTVDDAVAAQLGMFYAHAREGKRPRRIVGILHDTRVAGWDWTGADKALSPQIRQIILSIGKVYPNFKQAMAALDAEPESAKA